MKRILICILIASFLYGCKKEEGITIITWAVGKDPTRFHDTLIAKFEKKFPTIKVRLLEMPESATTMHDAYVTYLSARDPSVDVYSIDIIWPAEFGSAEWLLPLNEYISDEEMEAFLPGPIKGCTYRGSLYAIPWFTDGGVLYYRTDLLKKENLVPPSTWTELVHHSKLLGKKYRVYGFVFQAHQYEGLVCNFLEYVWSNGGKVFNKDGNVVINSDEAVESLQFMKDIIHKYKITPPGVVTYKEEEARRLFTEGKACFMRNWPYVWAIAQDSAKGSKVVGKVGIAPMVHPEGGSTEATLGGWNLAVSKFSKHPLESIKFVKFITSYEIQKLFAIKGGRLPTRKRVYEDREVLNINPHYRNLYEVFVSARPRPVTPYYTQLSDILQIEVHQSLIGKKSPKEALDSAKEKIEEVLSPQ